MTNKEYKTAREIAENASEKFTSEKWNGVSFYPSNYMDRDELNEMRTERKAEKKNGALILEGFNTRAALIPVDGGYILKSYYTNVAAVIDGKFYKLWAGYSHTTLKHVNIFCDFMKIPGFNKREWIETETTAEIINPATGEYISIAA